MDPTSRPRANTLGLDASTAHLQRSSAASSLGKQQYQRVRKVSGGRHVLEDVDESGDYMLDSQQHPKAAAIAATDSYSSFQDSQSTLSSALPIAALRTRSRTVATDVPIPRPLSAMMRTPTGDSQRTARPLSSLMIDPPDSPSVTGLKGRHKLQQREFAADMGASSANSAASAISFMRNKNWCDVERQNLAAYEYLCHVCEAKEWIEACIKEELPGIEDMEGSLRDGVALAKLAQTFCPEAVGKIYQDKSLNSAPKLTNGVRQRFVFKYTDNINFFLRAIRQVRLPRLFHFELTDLYDRKNMPKVIYCLHALSHFLLRMGIAPEMRDLVGHLEFSDAQLKQTQAELDNLGANMPSFHLIDSSIGNRRPRLSRQVCPLQPEDLNDEDGEDESDDEQEEAQHTIGKPRSVSFNEDVTYLDDPSIERMEKAKRYWQRRIDIVVQYQAMARQRLAERLLEEKKQARRYLRMVESATTMQNFARTVLARRQLQEYRDEVIAAQQKAEEEERQVREETERKRLQQEEEEEREQRRLEQLLEERARKDRLVREQADKERAMQDRLEVERQELERRIVGVQALIRGRLARKVYTEMRGWTAAIVRFQALCRGDLVRREIGDRLSMWSRVEKAVRRAQALARGYLVRQRIKGHKTHLRRNVNVIVKMQNMYRAKLAGKAYRTLTVEDTPPTPKIVQSCAPLLEDTDQDLEEELELERLRQKAVRQIRENQQTGRILDQLDIKIALLVRNRISLEEVLRQTKRHFRFLEEVRRPLAPVNSNLNIGILRGAYPGLVDGPSSGGAVPSSSLYSLRNMDKESRKKLEGYQNLFYLLQTQPIYLARLLFLLNQGGSKAMRPSQSVGSANGSSGGGGLAGSSNKGGSDGGEEISISKLIETIVLTLFGFAQNAREEYLLLKLFCASIQLELSAINTLPEFLRGNPIFIKLAVHYNRGAKERKYLRDLLQPLIKKVIDDPDLDLESDPLSIYRTLIREEESRTGEKSRRPYDISREDALNDMETRTTFIRHLRQLRVLADEFIAAIQGSLSEMPYGMRYIARELRRALVAKFPDEPESQVMKIVGHLVYYRYINPAIVAPESFDVIETTISPLQRKNLAEIAKMLNQVSVGKHFNEDNMFLQPLNNYVGYTSAKFLSYSFEVTEVVDPEVHFQVDEFTDLATLNKPSILMSIGEIQAIHQALEANLDSIAPPIPEQIKQMFGSYEAVIGIIEKRRKQEESRANGVAGGDDSDSMDVDGEDDEETDLADAIPQGTVLVERPATDGSGGASGRVLVLEDPLRVILQDLGIAPRARVDPYARYEIHMDLTDRFADDSITIMSGSAATSVLAASASQILSDAAISASQVTYSSGGLLRHQPTAKEAVHAKAERAAKLHRLFLETKRKWLSILRVQSGSSLLEILERQVTAEDESRWRATIQLELAKLEERRQRHIAQWQRQWEAQQQAALLRESQDAIAMSISSASLGLNGRPASALAAAHRKNSSSASLNGRSSPAPQQQQQQQQMPPPPPPLPGEKVIRELAQMTFSELKRQVAKAMRVLETERWVERTRKSNIGTGNNAQQGQQADGKGGDTGAVRPAYATVFRVRRGDGYQGMLNAIARDIRTKAQRRERRRAEMRRIRITLLNLKEKSDYLESQRQSYEQYLDACTKKLAAGGDSSVGAAQARQARKMHSVLPFTRQYFHLRDLQRSGRVPRFGSYKYSAEKLYYKGVIVSVEGYPPRQLDKISLTISSDVPGIFDVQVSLMGVKMPGGGCEIRMQDLLQLQYDNVQTMTLYEGSVVVNTNLLVFLINKKFYA
ncbi:iqgap- protein [Coemansia spiralis]|uniref:Iqgap- protein n=2 Tax=Coemansia TaxID=4863 RepID=A0A9W8KWC5_9FUNG|nr:iqgap- protein [Coemansia umbellata]KAJ2622652.1 iqgap- protein [Coemansia sp. RSA 1358]KAJ2671280.1 iqgap- protein [Coemansia spiralis]